MRRWLLARLIEEYLRFFPFLKLGTGAQFEIPGLRCFLTEDQTGRASQLAKGQKVTVVGKVSGLTWDVVVNDCRIE